MSELMECKTCGGKLSSSATSCPHCGEDGGAAKVKSAEFIEIESKSRIISLILTILLGPLGLMYSSVLWGVILLIVALVGAPTLFIPAGVWIVSIIAGDSATYNHNIKIEKQAKIVG